jgi:drug/metabolite transporter (DMT)-like permease
VLPSGFFLAAAAAVAFGATDFLGALVSRRTGAAMVVLAVCAISVVVLAFVAAITSAALPSDASSIAQLLLLGAVFALSYAALFEGLRRGPLSVVSPITTAYGAATVVLAAIFLGERANGLQLAGVTLATLGAAATSVVADTTSKRVSGVGGGPLFGVIGLLGQAVVTVALRDRVRLYGSMPALLVLRVGATLAAGGLAMVIAKRRASRPLGPTEGAIRPGLPARYIVGLGTLGLIDTLAQALVATALLAAPAWLVGVVSSCGPVLVTSAALALLGERLRPNQWLGLVLLALGLISVNLG